ncbi:MAG: di-trans,poly-cis-decaprenylcistransferase [Ruminococcaceae bacterium]|nr:di-trans,poly-cis-decaprenylcistransferase [Oscillospiraceae bacterium]
MIFSKTGKGSGEAVDIAALVKDTGLCHIAFIMDGNGRWAKKRSLPREAGHPVGAKTFKKVVRYCGDIGINNITVYAFSTENWSRPKSEVDAIMSLLDDYIKDAKSSDDENHIKYVFLGDKAQLGEALANKCRELEELTKNNKLLLNIALNYGGRAEIVYAVNKLIAEGRSEITEKDISDSIYTAHCPDPDLIVRTAGEVRTSNFLLWQSAYSEYYFTDVLWPDFDEREVDKAVIDFSKRKRRFGGVVNA